MKLLIIITIALLIGCTVSSDEIAEAMQKCEANGGIMTINPSSLPTNTYCKNGAMFFLEGRN